METYNKLVLVSLSSPHLKTFYQLIQPLFKEILIISDEKQDYCKTEIINFKISKPIVALQNIKKLRNLITEFQPDIVHVHQANSVALVTGMAVKKNFPLVLTAWGSDVLVLPKQSWIKKKIAQTAIKYSSVVTADASFMETDIKKLVPSSRVIIANFGIEIKDQLSSRDIENKQNIVYSNRLHYPLYNIKDLIEGFAEFVKENPNWKLIIAGKGDLTSNLLSLSERILPRQNYEFVGFIKKEENYAYYKSAKIWISIPESDGTAVSLLEAMHFGCIPVVSNLPANREWISTQEESTNGVIVEKSVAEALTKASGLHIQSVYAQNKTIIETKASIESMRKLYTNLYAQLIIKH